MIIINHCHHYLTEMCDNVIDLEITILTGKGDDVKMINKVIAR